jgi:hypothetical protein
MPMMDFRGLMSASLRADQYGWAMEASPPRETILSMVSWAVSRFSKGPRSWSPIPTMWCRLLAGLVSTPGKTRKLSVERPSGSVTLPWSVMQRKS